MLKGIVEKEVGDVKEVYDPTCGRGALLSVFGDDVVKYGQDINASEVEVAKNSLANFNGVIGDTLKEPAFLGKKFKAIVANPPFSIPWDSESVFFDERFAGYALAPKSKADYAFNLHILHYLSDDGCAAVINFPGVLYRGNSEGKIRKALVENNLINEVVLIPGGYFDDTSVATCVIVYKKNKQDTNIIFTDKELNLSKSVSVEEVAKNDFNLSVSQYVFVEKVKPPFDAVATELQARADFIANMRKELEFSRMVCDFEGIDFEEFPRQIIQTAQSYIGGINAIN
nr:MAG TPA: N-6 DNA Methylase [Caudoviricetes sp.]